MGISGTIRYLRKNMGYSQIDLAKLLNVDKQTVGAWERGAQEPRSDKICALAKIFKVSSDRLLGLKENEKSSANGFRDGFGSEFRFEFRQEPNLYIERLHGFGLSDIM